MLYSNSIGCCIYKMQKTNMRKKIVRIFILLFFFNALGISYAQSSETNKVDSIFCFINNDTIVDYITVNKIVNRPYTSVILNIYVSLDSLTHKRYSKKIDLGEGISYVNYDCVGDFLEEQISYNPRMGDYDVSWYKYFYQLDDWVYYGGYKDDAMVFGIWKSKGLRLGDTTWVDIPNNITDSMTQIFHNDYDTYCIEYKSKKHDKIRFHDENKTLEYLNYIEFNKSTIQKYNDIGFFLSEAGNYYQAINILTRVVFYFPKRTVAYLNLGDAYWGVKKQKQAKEAYEKYIELMKTNGKESKIPQRVYERIKKESTEEF